MCDLADRDARRALKRKRSTSASLSSSSSTLTKSAAATTSTPAVLVPASNGHNVSPEAPGSVYTSLRSVNQALLDQALARLSGHDHQTLDHLLSTSARDADDQVDRTISALQQCKQQYKDTHETFAVAGRVVTIGQQVDRVMHWVEDFKTASVVAGDVGGKVIRAGSGLLWAGLSPLLQAAVGDANNIILLLVGLELALYTATRINIHADFLHQSARAHDQTRDLARTCYQTSLIELYACLLHFQAQALRLHHILGPHHITRAFWEDSDIRQFETECHELGARLDVDASSCDSALYKQRFLPKFDELQNNHRPERLSPRHVVQIDFDRLPYADGAEFDAHSSKHSLCHPGTRTDVLNQIQAWAQQPDGKRIFWLKGLAGTGKSTISRTIAGRLASQDVSKSVDLGASFFFKRDGGDRGSVTRFFPTIVRQLFEKMPQLAPLVAEAVNREPRICGKLLGEQFRKLLYQPLQSIPVAHDNPTFVVVVDALDECNEIDDIHTIIQLWSRLPEITRVRLQLFVTSRPEQSIRLGFENMAGGVYRDMVLHEVSQPIIEHDISAFLRDNFSTIRQTYNSQGPTNRLDEHWPGEEVLQLLTKKTAPLFIAAVTVCRFVGASGRSPSKRLKTFLDSKVTSDLSQLADTYLPVLSQLLTTSRNSHEREQLHEEFKTVVGAIVVLAYPLPIISLSSLLQLDIDDVEVLLRELHSVLRIPSDSHKPVQILHLSFAEFLLDASPDVQHPFSVDRPGTHRMLLCRCLQLLSGPDGLRENMCALSSPGHRQQAISSNQIKQCLPPEIQYACQNWVFHALRSQSQIHDYDLVHTFLEQHFLHWLEALSLTGELAPIICHIDDLLAILIPGRGSLWTLLTDARRFVLAHRQIVGLAPLQVYSSAMIFSPQRSDIRELYDRSPAWIQQGPIVPKAWGMEQQRLEGPTHSINSAKFSPDGRLLASASDDKTVWLWQVQLGHEVQRLEGHTAQVFSVAFSPDGTLLASASTDSTIRLWQVQTGHEVQRLEGHVDGVRSVVFSPDGTLLASASNDKTVRLWQVRTGHEVQKLEGHAARVRSVAFSPNGTVLASVSSDQTVRLWDVQTGHEVQKLEGHTDDVLSAAFSPDGALLASASSDRTVRIWQVATGHELHRLAGYTSSVVFSPNGTLLASASSDSTVRLWHVQTGHEVQRLEGHTMYVNSLAFSLDGALLASASSDRTVRLWQVETGHKMQQLEGHSDYIRSVVFSSDGALLASASDDRTVRVWQVRTGHEVQRLQGHGNDVFSVVFSPDCTLLASTSSDKTIRLWQVQTGHEVQRLEGHTDDVLSAAFSPDGALLASVSRDWTVRLWQVQTGREVRRFGHPSCVESVTFLSDSTLLASANIEGKTEVWQVYTGAEVQQMSKSEGLNVRFTDDGIALFTSPGSIHLEQKQTRGKGASTVNKSAPNRSEGFQLENEWIQLDGRDVLWLPHEYRTDVWAVWGDTIALGRSSGIVSIIQLNSAVLKEQYIAFN